MFHHLHAHVVAAGPQTPLDHLDAARRRARHRTRAVALAAVRAQGPVAAGHIMRRAAKRPDSVAGDITVGELLRAIPGFNSWDAHDHGHLAHLRGGEPLGSLTADQRASLSSVLARLANMRSTS